MKTRMGFVSNSSSSSFVIAKAYLSDEQIKGLRAAQAALPAASCRQGGHGDHGDLMRYAKLKALLMDAYPTLFVDETDVLHHLFFTNGNGYDWVDGELVDVCREDSVDLIEERRKWRVARIEKNIAEELKLGVDENGPDGIRLRHCRAELELVNSSPAVQRAAERRQRMHNARHPFPNIKARAYCLVEGKLKRYLYPLCEYADILHTPDDVKPDWLQAARKALSLVGKTLIHMPGDTRRNKVFLRWAEKRIKELTHEST